MEAQPAIQVPDDAKCKACGYALYLNTTGRCPECGREFDPADRTTFHRGCYDQAQRLLRWMLDARMTLGWLFCLGFVIGVMGNGRTAIIFMVASIVASVVTLYFQTRLANLMLGRKEAVRYLFIALLVPPMLLAGPLLVPSLVAAEVRPRLK